METYFSKTIHQNLLRLTQFLFVILCISLLTGCESRKTIVNGLDEREANEILVFLSTKGIDATKVQAKEAGGGGGGSKTVMWDISVPEEQSIEAMALLNQAGLPRRRSQNLLGIFSNVGLVPSEMQEKIRYQAGLAEQIASTIRKIDGVLDAEVQISFPEEDPLNPGATKGKITASVYVKHNGVLDDPNSHLITKIKRLVAASVTGLDYDNVTVIPELARNTVIGPGGISNPEAAEEKQYVSIWTVIVAQESATRFRILFFSFTVIILLLILSMIWSGWKLYPLLKQHGGVKELFNIHPIAIEGAKKPEKEADKESPKDTKPPESQTTADKGIDET